MANFSRELGMYVGNFSILFIIWANHIDEIDILFE